MWRPQITSNYDGYNVSHNAILSGTDQYYYPFDVLHWIPAQPRMIGALWSDDSGSKRGAKTMKRCEHYVFAAAETGTMVAGFRVHGGSGAYSWNYVNGIPGPWFWDICSSHLGGTVMMTSLFGDYGTLRPAKVPSLYRGDVDVNRVVDVPNLQGLMTIAYQGCMPSIRSELSLVNSVYELKDFKTLPKQLAQAWKTLQRLVSVNGYRLKKLLKVSSGAQITGQVAGAYLQSEFNIKPLIQDIAAVKRCLSKSKKSLQKLIKDSRKLRKVHYRVPLAKTFRAVNTLKEWSHQTGGLIDRYSMRYDCNYSDDTAFTMTVLYSYELENLSELELKVGALLDYVGIQLNPQIVWNAIPWSFVVDWFVGVSQLLATIKLTNVRAVVKVHSACYSTKVDRIITLAGSYNGSGGLFRQVRETAYKRVPLKPDWIGTGLRVSDFSSKEISLAVALGLSRWKRFLL